jgi:ATP-binding protein involved in chromosome partitioning
MFSTLKSRVEALLRAQRLPDGVTSLADSGLVRSITVNDDAVIVVLEVAAQQAPALEPLRADIEARLKELKGVASARVILTAVRQPSAIAARPAPARLAPPTPKTVPAPPQPKPLRGVRHVIAVASGKGGVGKSTTAVNLAFGFQALGLKAGLVDCDIFGPSASVLLGSDARPQADADKRIIPLYRDGLASMSMSNLMPMDTAAVWRGPMVIKAVKQLLEDVAWDHRGPLDVLVADMPPGTGDVQLTLAQTAELDGAVIVSTPQDLALIDARRAWDMYRKTNTRVFGVIENMSYFLCPHCGERSDVFGHGGARETAAALGLPFLGEIPLHMGIRESADAGMPVSLSDPEGPLGRVYVDLARQILAALRQGEAISPAG